MRVFSNSDLSKMADEKERAASALSSSVVVDRLSSYIRDRYDLALSVNETLMDEMESSHRQRQGKYDSSKLAEIRKIGGSEIFRRMTSTKCLAAEAWISDILGPAGDRPWGLDPTPLPDVSPEDRERIVSETVSLFESRQARGESFNVDDVVDYAEQARDLVLERERDLARKAADRMSDLIQDQLVEGGYVDAFRDLTSHVVTYKYGVLKGPVFRRRKKLSWSRGDDGEYKMIRSDVNCLEFEAPSPLDVYFAPDMRRVDEGWIIEKQRYSRGELYGMIGVDGYDESAIRSVLESAAVDDILDETDNRRSDRLELQNRDDSSAHTGDSGVVEAIEYHGGAPGRLLMEWGLKVDDPDAEYEIWAIMVKDTVIKAEINPDPLGRRPYYVTSFEKNPGSLVGFGVPDKMRDTQAMCNATIRALSNNLALASGPQIFVDPSNMPPGEDIRSIRPLKIWQLDRKGVGGQLPVTFYQPNDNSRSLIAVYEQMKKEMDDDTGVPRYIYGDQNVGGAGSTASGLSMLMNAASKGIKNVILNFDQDVVRPLLTRLYEYNMLHSDDPSVKGDLRIVARGALALVVKEQLNIARREYLRDTANEYDMELVGLEGRLKLHREIVKDLGMPESLLPTVEEFRERQRMKSEQMAAAEQEAARLSAGDGNQRPQRNIPPSE